MRTSASRRHVAATAHGGFSGRVAGGEGRCRAHQRKLFCAGARDRVPARRLSDLERRRGFAPGAGERLVFAREAGERPDFGALEFRAGFVLASADARFGGLSGLWIAPDGERLIAASDRGTLWLAGLEHADDGTLLGFAGWRAVEPGALPGDPGHQRDAEALAVTGGDLVIAYEGAHRLRRVPLAAPDGPPQRWPPRRHCPGRTTGASKLWSRWTTARFGDCRRRAHVDWRSAAWLIEGDRIASLAYAPAAGFVPTGADRLDDTIYVLERRLSLNGLVARVVVLDVAEIRPGARLVGRELGVIGPPAISENFEGIAARRAADGGVLLYLLADDNFLALLRSLLLQFSVRVAPSDPARF